MHRTDGDGHVANEFDDGDPAIPQVATQVDAAWLNAVQGELANAIEGAGVTLVKGTNTQLRDILNAMMQASPPGGRLTLTTAVPVTTSDVSAAGTVYYTPYKGNRLALYDGSRWVGKTFAELSQATTDATKSPAAAANNSNYDVFVWNDSGTLRATRGPAWNSDTARGTGAGTTELELFEGRYVNKVAITNGPAARRGLYVGTVRTDGAAVVNDTLALRHVWNMYNRVERVMRVLESTDSWVYTTATWRQANNAATNQLDYVQGLAEDPVHALVNHVAGNANAAAVMSAAIGLDSTAAVASGCLTAHTLGSGNDYPRSMTSHLKAYPGIGRHYLAWLEQSSADGATSWYGDAPDAGHVGLTVQSGIHGALMG